MGSVVWFPCCWSHTAAQTCLLFWTENSKSGGSNRNLRSDRGERYQSRERKGGYAADEILLSVSASTACLSGPFGSLQQTWSHTCRGQSTLGARRGEGQVERASAVVGTARRASASPAGSPCRLHGGGGLPWEKCTRDVPAGTPARAWCDSQAHRSINMRCALGDVSVFHGHGPSRMLRGPWRWVWRGRQSAWVGPERLMFCLFASWDSIVRSKCGLIVPTSEHIPRGKYRRCCCLLR